MGHVGDLNWCLIWYIHTNFVVLSDHSPLPPSISARAISLNIRPKVMLNILNALTRYGRRSQRGNHYSRARYTEGKIVYIVGRVDGESEAGGYL